MNTSDEIWLLPLPVPPSAGPAKPEHLLVNPADIPLVRIDRGGQITYHGPGHWWPTCCWTCRGAGSRCASWQSGWNGGIDTLADYGLAAERKGWRAGRLIAGDKIAALGLRVRNGCSYHGLAINVDADLAPHGWIQPLATGAKTIRMKDFGIDVYWTGSASACSATCRPCCRPSAPPMRDQPPGAVAGTRRAIIRQRRRRTPAPGPIARAPRRMAPALTPHFFPTETHRDPRGTWKPPARKQRGADKTPRIPIKIVPAERLKKPGLDPDKLGAGIGGRAL